MTARLEPGGKGRGTALPEETSQDPFPDRDERVGERTTLRDEHFPLPIEFNQGFTLDLYARTGVPRTRRFVP